MVYAVTGATGQLGRLVIDKLKDVVGAGEIVALARTPEKARELGVTVRVFDYDRPDGLAEALAGIDTLLLISGSEVGQRLPQHQNVIAAAKAAGVGRIVYTSLLRADSSPLSLAEEHRQTEAALKASGLTTTILRNGWYLENYEGSIGAGLAHGAVVGSAGDGRIAAATRADYADAAVAALTGVGHENKVYELAGSDPFTLSGLADELSKQTGKPIGFTNLPVDEYAKVLEGAGLPAGMAEVFAGFDVATAQGALDGSDADFRALTGHGTTPLKDYVARVLNG